MHDAPLTSIRGLARAVGKSHTAVAKWLKHPEWAWDKRPPWGSADVEDMKTWAAETLAPDRAGEADLDPFWAVHIPYPALRIPDDPAPDALKLPAEICTPLERDVLRGKRTLSKAELAELIGRYVRFKALLVQSCDFLPGWLERQDGQEIGRRMRSEVYGRMKWLQECFAGMADAQDGIERDDDGKIINRRSKPAK